MDMGIVPSPHENFSEFTRIYVRFAEAIGKADKAANEVGELVGERRRAAAHVHGHAHVSMGDAGRAGPGHSSEASVP